MATDFTQESVLRFIISNGGTVRNADLLSHYRRFLREDERREENRELFKRYVNSVATVRQEEGVSHVVLRKKYRAHLGDVAEDPERAALTAPARVEVLPAAGIVTNNNNNNIDFTPSVQKAVKTQPAHAREQHAAAATAAAAPSASACAKQVNNNNTLKSDWDGLSSGSKEQPLESSSVYLDKQRQLGEADGCERRSLVTPTHCAYYEVRASPKASPLHSTLAQSHVFNSSPCLVDRLVDFPHALSLSRSNDSLLPPNGGFDGFPIQERDEDDTRPESATYLRLSRDGLPSTPPDTGWPQEMEDGNDVRSFLRRTQEAKLLSQLHQPVTHRSTGHLDDGRSTRSSSPETCRGPIVRRMTSRLRSRMCRSLGEDLDQPFPEDNVSARHNRLQLLSSTLSMGNLASTSSSREFSSPVGSAQSLHDTSIWNKPSSVPLDSREHAWFVKAASGSWTDIYALFRDDPNLLYKRDFISGFTVFHWIAKHGDHRVLNTLCYGVEKSGMTLDVDAKTLCGYTPLHLASIHGHKKLIRLLVQKYKADVRIRDSGGKRPWQYLSKDENRDILELLGAPQKRINGSPAMPADLPERPTITKVNVKRHSSIAALFKHKSHLRVSSSPEAF